MAKNVLLVMLLWLAGCAGQARTVTLPAAVEGGWKLTMQDVVAEPPGKIPMLKPLRALRGSYDGPTAIAVEVYQFRNTTGAFEALQSWRPDGRVVRHKNDLFLVAGSPQPDRSAIDTFLNGMEKAL